MSTTTASTTAAEAPRTGAPAQHQGGSAATASAASTVPHLHLGINAGSAWLDALPLLGEAKIAPGVEKVYELK